MATPQHPHWQNDPAVLSAARNAPALKLGASGSGVQRLREALAAVDAPPVAEPLDRFGPLTVTLLKTFQGLYNLSNDGAAGTQTIGRLDDLLLGRAARKPWPAPAPAPAPASSKEEFLQKVFDACAPVLRARDTPYRLPVSAMLACAAVESGWGNGPIYRETGNLFSLQKWPWAQYPITAHTLWRNTVIQNNPIKIARAPFNTATDMADAGRQWCEWIEHYGQADGPPGNLPQDKHKPPRANAQAMARRTQLTGMANDPVLFARNLYLVGFGENLASGQIYARVLQENNLTRFD